VKAPLLRVTVMVIPAFYPYSSMQVQQNNS
jgi:hypothetical protein